jgi:uncharacterized membrane protein YpjA
LLAAAAQKADAESMGLNYACVEKVLWAVAGNFTWIGKNVPWRAKGYHLILTNQAIAVAATRLQTF